MTKTTNQIKNILKSFLIAIWFMFLTFPFMAVSIDSLKKTVSLRWTSIGYVGIATFFLSFLWRDFMNRKDSGKGKTAYSINRRSFVDLNHFKQKRILIPSLTAAFLLIALFPLFVSSYQTNIMTNALLYVMLGLGLNIVVGLAGLLDLGYVAFYAVGAYLYALLNHHFGISFWLALPLGAVLASIFGILLDIPVLRLKGDYLAIVTLGFGEIIRLILENWDQDACFWSVHDSYHGLQTTGAD